MYTCTYVRTSLHLTLPPCLGHHSFEGFQHMHTGFYARMRPWTWSAGRASLEENSEKKQVLGKKNKCKPKLHRLTMLSWIDYFLNPNISCYNATDYAVSTCWHATMLKAPSCYAKSCMHSSLTQYQYWHVGAHQRVYACVSLAASIALQLSYDSIMRWIKCPHSRFRCFHLLAGTPLDIITQIASCSLSTAVSDGVWWESITW